jgi:hypothetical protein
MAIGEKTASEGNEQQTETINSTFRNGSLTAIGIIVGFSLGFLTRWAGVPGNWTAEDLVAVVLIVIGIVFQIVALGQFLSIHSLVLANYNRAVRVFLIGLVLVAVGVAFVILADILGYGGTVLQR